MILQVVGLLKTCFKNVSINPNVNPTALEFLLKMYPLFQKYNEIYSELDLEVYGDKITYISIKGSTRIFRTTILEIEVEDRVIRLKTLDASPNINLAFYGTGILESLGNARKLAKLITLPVLPPLKDIDENFTKLRKVLEKRGYYKLSSTLRRFVSSIRELIKIGGAIPDFGLIVISDGKVLLDTSVKDRSTEGTVRKIVEEVKRISGSLIIAPWTDDYMGAIFVPLKDPSKITKFIVYDPNEEKFEVYAPRYKDRGFVGFYRRLFWNNFVKEELDIPKDAPLVEQLVWLIFEFYWYFKASFNIEATEVSSFDVASEDWSSITKKLLNILYE